MVCAHKIINIHSYVVNDDAYIQAISYIMKPQRIRPFSCVKVTISQGS